MQKVMFYKEDDGQILAVFPEENYTDRNDLTKVCYSAIGQHSGAAMDYINSLSKAIEEEYAPLLSELKRQGYRNLQVLNPY